MDQYQQKVNNYMKQCIVEIYNYGVEYYNEDDGDTNDVKMNKSKRNYILAIESSLKKLLNNTESIASHMKFELINNSTINAKKNIFNNTGILDMINCMESDYESNDDGAVNGNDSNDETVKDDNNEEFNGTDSVKASKYIDDNNEDEEDGEDGNDNDGNDNDGNEEDGNIFYDASIDDDKDEPDEQNELDGCLVRQKRTERKLADDNTPSIYFKDLDGYIYGQHCGRNVYKDNLCEGHYMKKIANSKLELVTDHPIKYENTKGKRETTYSDSEQSLTRSKAQELKTIVVKKKNYLLDESNGHIFDHNTHKFLGKRVKNGKRWAYKFNS